MYQGLDKQGLASDLLCWRRYLSCLSLLTGMVWVPTSHAIQHPSLAFGQQHVHKESRCSTDTKVDLTSQYPLLLLPPFAHHCLTMVRNYTPKRKSTELEAQLKVWDEVRSKVKPGINVAGMLTMAC
jgi:hypothetical protein